MYCEMYSLGSDTTACKAVSFDPQQLYEQPSLTIRSYIRHTGEEMLKIMVSVNHLTKLDHFLHLSICTQRTLIKLLDWINWEYKTN